MQRTFRGSESLLWCDFTLGRGPQQRKPHRQVRAIERAARKRYKLRDHHSEHNHESKEPRSESVFAEKVAVVVAEEGEENDCG